MDLAKTMEGLTELENLAMQLEAWEGMISAGYQCPAAGISMLNAAKHLADIAHKLRTGKLIVVDHPQATSPVDEPINATDAAFMAGEAIYQRDGVSPFLREVMQLRKHNSAMPSLAAKDAEKFRHMKRGTIYEVIGTAELQMTYDNLVDGSDLVIYRGEDGKMWCREEGEFHDGRFQALGDEA